MVYHKTKQLVLSVLMVLMLSWFSQFTALAYPALQPNAETQNWDFPLERFGYPSVIRLSGQIAERTLFLTIPDGLQPQELNGRLRFSSDVQSGYLEIYADDTLLDTLTLDHSPQDIRIPLNPLTTNKAVLSIRLIARLRSLDDVCATALAGSWLQLEDSHLVLAGMPQSPQTVADYFPPLLEKVTIYVPAQPSAAQAQVALKLAAMLARRYAAKPIQIKVETLSQNLVFPKNPSFERSVVIGKGEKGLALFPATDNSLPILTISGDDQELLKTASIFDQTFFPLLAAPQVQILNYTSPTEIQAKQVTFQALGYSSQQVSGVGRMDITLSFAQADLGGAVKDLYARLVGNYTPIPVGASGTVSVFFNSALVYSALLNQDGRFDFYIPLPQMLIQRDNTLILRFDYTPKGGDCRVGVQPFTAGLLNASYLQVDFGESLPEGFIRIPQALFPHFVIGMQPQNKDNVARALALIMELQQMTKSPLDFRVVDWNEALNSNQGAMLISEDGQGLEGIHPPLLPMPLRVVDLNGKELLRVEENVPFAALEAFQQNHRDIILLTAQKQALMMDKAIECVQSLPDGWYSLLGDVLFVSQENGCGVSLNLRKSGLYVQPLKPTFGVWWVRIRPYAFGILLFLLLLFVVWAYPKVVRKQPPGL